MTTGGTINKILGVREHKENEDQKALKKPIIGDN